MSEQVSVDERPSLLRMFSMNSVRRLNIVTMPALYHSSMQRKMLHSPWADRPTGHFDVAIDAVDIHWSYCSYNCCGASVRYVLDLMPEIE